MITLSICRIAMPTVREHRATESDGCKSTTATPRRIEDKTGQSRVVIAVRLIVTLWRLAQLSVTNTSRRMDTLGFPLLAQQCADNAHYVNNAMSGHDRERARDHSSNGRAGPQSEPIARHSRGSTATQPWPASPPILRRPRFMRPLDQHRRVDEQMCHRRLSRSDRIRSPTRKLPAPLKRRSDRSIAAARSAGSWRASSRRAATARITVGFDHPPCSSTPITALRQPPHRDLCGGHRDRQPEGDDAAL